MAQTVEAVFIVLRSREAFKIIIKYILQTVANQFLISISLMSTHEEITQSSYTE